MQREVPGGDWPPKSQPPTWACLIQTGPGGGCSLPFTPPSCFFIFAFAERGLRRARARREYFAPLSSAKEISDPLATTPLKKILSFLRGPVATQPGIKQSGNIQGPQNFHLFFVPHCMPDSERQKISGILEVVSWQRVRARRVASRRALAVPSGDKVRLKLL